MIMKAMKSAAVGLNASLHGLAHHAHHHCVLAALYAEGDAAADACTEEKRKTPDPSYASRSFP
jgi:hypothetical protein